MPQTHGFLSFYVRFETLIYYNIWDEFKNNLIYEVDKIVPCEMFVNNSVKIDFVEVSCGLIVY